MVRADEVGPRQGRKAMTELIAGFGLNFYGYFAFAGVWVGAYFFWAWRTNARERQRDSKHKSSTEAHDK